MKIIDNKKIDITDQEYDAYIKICRSYDRTSFKGEELFKELFETDNAGIITFIRPPSTKYTSFEVVSFAFYLYNTQQIRIIKKQCDLLLAQTNEKVNEALAKLTASK